MYYHYSNSILWLHYHYVARILESYLLVWHLCHILPRDHEGVGWPEPGLLYREA